MVKSYELVYPLTVDTTLFSYTVFFCLFHAPLDVAVHFLVFLRSFRFESFLSQFSPSHRSRISAVTQGFLFWQSLPRISLAVSVTALLKVVIIQSMSAFSLFMMVRSANFLPIIAWQISNTLGSFSFSRSNLSLVCFGLLILFKGGSSSSASRDHFQCLLPENYMFWHCSLLIGSTSSLKYNQTGPFGPVSYTHLTLPTRRTV